jgi:EpsI family protein
MTRSPHPYRLLALNAALVLALAGSHWGRRIDAASLDKPDLFQQAGIAFRDWKSTDQQLSASERELLLPDASLIRRFESASGQAVELAVVAGHRKQTIHTPGFCMAGGGWELSSQRVYTLQLPGGPVPATRAVMVRNGARVVATYFFTDGRFSTPNLMRFQGEQLLRRLKGEAPLGALVRILVPCGEKVSAAERLSDDFAAATIPKVMASVRNARLTP